MTSQLRVDKILPVDGAPTGGAGGVVQVQSTTKTDTFQKASGDTFQDVTGLSVSITPKFSTSKILVSVGVQIYSTNSSYHAYVGIVKNDSGDFSGSGHPAGVLHHTSCLWENSGPGQAGNVSFQYLDSPNTTSQVKYSIYIKSDNTSNTVYINGSSHSDGYISAMEVSA